MGSEIPGSQPIVARRCAERRQRLASIRASSPPGPRSAPTTFRAAASRALATPAGTGWFNFEPAEPAAVTASAPTEPTGADAGDAASFADGFTGWFDPSRRGSL